MDKVWYVIVSILIFAYFLTCNNKILKNFEKNWTYAYIWCSIRQIFKGSFMDSPLNTSPTGVAKSEAVVCL